MFISQTNKSLLAFFLTLSALFQMPGTVQAKGNVSSSTTSVNFLRRQKPILAKVPLKPVDKMPPHAPSIKTIKQNQARVRLQQGIEKHKSGQLAEAEELFRHAVALDPQNTDGFFNLGALAEGRGDLISALSNYRAALHIKPDDNELKQAVQSIEQQLTHNVLGQAKPVTTSVPASTDELNSAKTPPIAPSIPIDSHHLSFKELGKEPLRANVYQEALNLNSDLNDPSILSVNSRGQRPVVGVSPSNRPTLRATPQGKRKIGAVAGAALGILLSVGAGYATRGALHCPVCRVLGGF